MNEKQTESLERNVEKLTKQMDDLLHGISYLNSKVDQISLRVYKANSRLDRISSNYRSNDQGFLSTIVGILNETLAGKIYRLKRFLRFHN